MIHFNILKIKCIDRIFNGKSSEMLLCDFSTIGKVFIWIILNKYSSSPWIKI